MGCMVAAVSRRMMGATVGCGNEEAFLARVVPAGPKLRRLASRYAGNASDAEDICQESMLKAYVKMAQFSEREASLEGEFQAWLRKITANTAIDFLRRKQAKRFVSWEESAHGQRRAAPGMSDAGCGGLSGGTAAASPSAWGANPERAYLRKERRAQMVAAIAKLPVELRRVCLLRNVLEYTTKEAAARLGISTTAVRVRLFRAQARLRERMAEA
jgi:RNA polymerase sigma factor (sigma-70 family)